MNNSIPPIINRKIRIAVVGCGRIAMNHFSAIEKYSEHLELVAIADDDAGTLQKISDARHVSGYSTIDHLLAETNPDIVTLCTPSGLHAQQTIKVVLSGAHVITEKPMAIQWKDGLAMVRACQKSNRHLFVVKQNRFQPALQSLKKALSANRFGQLYMVNVNVFWTRPQEYYDQTTWRGTFALDGGAFMNQASHYVDLLDWLIGPVQSVNAMMATLGRTIETEDTGVLNIRWCSGVLGSMNVTMLTYPKNLEASLTILGEHGTVKIGGTSGNEILHWEFKDKTLEDDQIRHESKNGSEFGHAAYYHNVIETLRGHANPAVDGMEGLKSLEILTAAYRSVHEERTVHLPLEK